MVKLLYTLILIAFISKVYTGGIRSYFNALSETGRIVITAGIPLEERNSEVFRQKTIAVLKEKCKYGLSMKSIQHIRCVSGADFKLFK